MPIVSAALGCSPTARTRRPHRVLNRPTWSAHTRKNIPYTKMLFVNTMGPTIGMSLRTGIAIADTRWGALRLGTSVRTRADRKAVMPAAKMLMIVPAMIWSTLYRIASTASTQARRPPARAAPRMPIQGPKAEPTTADTKAPVSSMPSMAMLTTPARSHSTPDMAAKVSGVALTTLAWITPTRFIERPDAAHTRNVTTTIRMTL